MGISVKLLILGKLFSCPNI